MMPPVLVRLASDTQAPSSALPLLVALLDSQLVSSEPSRLVLADAERATRFRKHTLSRTVRWLVRSGYLEQSYGPPPSLHRLVRVVE